MNLQEKIKANTELLLASIKNVSETNAAFKPSADSWSILECLEHIFLVDVGVSKTLTVGPNQEISNDKTELIGADKLHHILVNKRKEFKVPAPDFVSPTGRFKSLAEATQSLQIILDKIQAHLKEQDITKETQTVKHPRLGEMTKTDWIHFLIAHTNRHIEQMEEVKKLF